MSLLGIDVGTAGLFKAAAFSAEGDCLAGAYREYSTLDPLDGWAELDSSHVLACLWETIAEVAARTARDPVAALCISSMGEAMTPVSKDRRIMGTCILSPTPAGPTSSERLAEQISREAFYAINPNILGPDYSLPKLLWLRHHRPELYEQADKFLLWGDLVAYMLGCDAITSYSHANRTLLFDIRKQDWSDPLLTLTGIERNKLPVPVSSGTIVGVVSDRVAKGVGLPHGVTVVVGGHDQRCNSLRAGIFRAGSSVCGIGTFECITPTFERIPDAAAMLSQGLSIEHHVLSNLFVSFIYNQAGALVRWFRDTFASADNKLLQQGDEIYEILAREMPHEPTRLLTLPYFEMTGPPGFVSDASGVIVGLKTSTRRGEILKSIMECVTFYFTDSINALRAMGMNTSEFIATGGGAKSDQWLQAKADIFNVPFVRLRTVEGSLLGASILAGISSGVLGSPAEGVSQFVKRERVFEPDAVRNQYYKEKLEAYRALFPLLKGFLAQLEKGQKQGVGGEFRKCKPGHLSSRKEST